MGALDEVKEFLNSEWKQISVFKKSKNWKQFKLVIAINHCEFVLS